MLMRVADGLEAMAATLTAVAEQLVAPPDPSAPAEPLPPLAARLQNAVHVVADCVAQIKVVVQQLGAEAEPAPPTAPPAPAS
jgi:hypothetical protein